MTVRGKVMKGKVLLDNPKALAEGTEVEVRPVKKRKPKSKTKPQKKLPVVFHRLILHVFNNANPISDKFPCVFSQSF